MGELYAFIGLGLMISLSGAGSAMGVSAGGSAVIGMMKKRPEAFGSGLVLAGLPATQGLYGFVAFINGTKDGVSWKESLATNYGVALERLVHFYGKSIGIKSLAP